MSNSEDKENILFSEESDDDFKNTDLNINLKKLDFKSQSKYSKNKSKDKHQYQLLTAQPSFKKQKNSELHSLKPSANLSNPNKKFNSTSSIYLFNSVNNSIPDQLIDAIASILLSQIIEDDGLPKQLEDKFMMFSEDKYIKDLNSKFDDNDKEIEIPCHSDIFEFISSLYYSAQFSIECCLVALIYINRIICLTGLTLTPKNWRPLVFISLIVSQKVNDDKHISNTDFSYIYPFFEVEQINILEMKYLEMIQYNVNVGFGCYMKYYLELKQLFAPVSSSGIGTGTGYGVQAEYVSPTIGKVSQPLNTLNTNNLSILNLNNNPINLLSPLRSNSNTPLPILSLSPLNKTPDLKQVKSNQVNLTQVTNKLSQTIHQQIPLQTQNYQPTNKSHHSHQQSNHTLSNKTIINQYTKPILPMTINNLQSEFNLNSSLIQDSGISNCQTNQAQSFQTKKSADRQLKKKQSQSTIPSEPLIHENWEALYFHLNKRVRVNSYGKKHFSGDGSFYVIN